MKGGIARRVIALSSEQHPHQFSSCSSLPFLSILEKCSCLKELKKIHAQAIISGLSQFAYITSRILARYTETGDMDDAYQLFDSINSPTIFNWNTIIRGFSRSFEPERGLFVFIKMRRTAVRPNMHAFPFAVKACGAILSLSQIHALVFVFGFNLDVYVTSSLIRNYSNFGEIELACRVFNECSLKNVVCWTSLISGYCSHDLLDRARQLFDEMPEKSDASWSAMVSGYVQNKRYEEAMELFLEMKGSVSANLNISLLVSALNACSAVGVFDEGRWIHSYIDFKGLEYGLELGTALLDFYAKCGFIEKAREVFDKMHGKDVTTWSAMIAGLAMNGNSHFAVQFFSEMLKSKVQPNAVTFIGLLTACNHGGLVDEGITYFKDMVAIHGISPSIEHYGCMVDLLSRAGKTKEAERMILSMPIEPDGAIWGSLLHGCFVHGDNEWGERGGSHIIKVEPEHHGRYVGLANAYASMGRWEGVAMVRRAMKERRIMATAGWSLVEVSGSAHRFLANDNTHPMVHEIYQILSDLTMDMVLNLSNSCEGGFEMVS
ncbi:pentatricopeptide repeat-containing protein At5g66520-like [Phalaenopsis equestris]|uniref:pentatricopeptide repeat-containing protein At5g66520-like n=1 Tax=Phalaenopsis equestris TaxID=78828 RepID=UPI0009E18BCF|nr:pentatricopeptide repeat-containing protein At5g66520-like [Phalaenopsis equestris]